jgi:hypothetical protein
MSAKVVSHRHHRGWGPQGIATREERHVAQLIRPGVIAELAVGADVPADGETTDEAIHAEPVAVASIAGSEARLSGWAKVLRAVRGGRGPRRARAAGARGLEAVRG